MTEMREVWINDRWPLLLPSHRADRPEWPWWEAGRLASMWHHLAVPHLHEYRMTGKPNGEVVYDIGAEEGDFPALFSSWGCDVVLFEPNDRVWPNIKAIWEANQLRPPLAMFVGFAGPDDDSSVSIGRADPEWALPERHWPVAADGPVIGDHGFKTMPEYPEVPRCSIDAMVRGGIKPPTALTIDVEGAEYEVLYGAVGTIYEHRPKIWVSVHPEAAAETYNRPDVLKDIQMLLLDCGYPLNPETGEMGTFLAHDHEWHWFFPPEFP